MDLQLDGKVAWVTGGSGGIGSAIAAALAAEGAGVAITGRTLSTLEEKAAAIGAASQRRVIAVPADVTDSDSVVNAGLARRFAHVSVRRAGCARGGAGG